MTTITLRELFNLVRTNAEKIFKEDGEVFPLWHAIAGNDEHMIISTPWHNDEEKEETIEILREAFADNKVQRYVFVSEAWSVLLHGTHDMSVAPSKHPDRREVLRITAEDRDGKRLSGMFYILRPEHGPVTLSPFREDKENSYESGRMSGLLRSTTR